MSFIKQNIIAIVFSTFLLAIFVDIKNISTSEQQNANNINNSVTDKIEIDGSETVLLITEMAVKEFQTIKKSKIAFSIDSVGTGKGMDKFCHGKLDIVNASRPIDERELVICKANGVNFLELPIAYDAISVVVNPSNSWAASLKLADLKKIWSPSSQGKVISWKDVRPKFPDTPLRIFTVAASSGTYEYFTKAINGKAKVARTDVTNVSDYQAAIKGVTNDSDGISIISYAYASTHKDRLRSVGIDSGKGPIMPSIATVNNGSYTPLARPIFIYVSSKSLKKTNVKGFVDYYLAHVAKFALGQHYIPLSPTTYTKINTRAKTQKFGSAFGGKSIVGLKIEDFTTKIAK
jgi:phosphate transport system substrate-binding protein